MDQAFRTTFPSMHEAWETLAQAGTMAPGDQLTTPLPDGRVVHTLAIKRGMWDPVDSAAVRASMERALSESSAEAIAFHRIGTRCNGRLPWPTVAAAVESVAVSSETDIVVLTDDWDDLVDALQVGDQIRATVTSTPAFGAFLDIGYRFRGLIEVPELSVNHGLEIGQSLEIEIIQLVDHAKQVRARPTDPTLRRKRT